MKYKILKGFLKDYFNKKKKDSLEDKIEILLNKGWEIKGSLVVVEKEDCLEGLCPTFKGGKLVDIPCIVKETRQYGYQSMILK